MSNTFSDKIELLRDYFEKNHQEEYEPPKYNNEYLYLYRGEIKDEKFENYETNNPMVQVSNFGRIKYNNEIFKQDLIKEEKNYRYLTVKIPEYENPIKVSRMVAKKFVKNDDPERNFIVHHKSGNSLDNKFENLVYVSCFEHIVIHRFSFYLCCSNRSYNEKRGGCPDWCPIIDWWRE